MTSEQKEELKHFICRFYKDNDLRNDNDFIEILRHYSTFFKESKLHDVWYEQAKELLSDETRSDLTNVLHQTVQSVIDVVNRHDDLKELIAEKKKEIEADWNSNLDDKFHMTPSVDAGFFASCLDLSIENGEWVSDTDANLGIYVGNSRIVEVG